MACSKPASKEKCRPSAVDDRSQAVQSENAGRAAAPMQPRDGRPFLHKTCDDLDFALERVAITGDDIDTMRHLGVAAAIEADFAAVGDVQIDRDAFLPLETAEPRGLLAGTDRRREIRRGRIGRIARHVRAGVAARDGIHDVASRPDRTLRGPGARQRGRRPEFDGVREDRPVVDVLLPAEIDLPRVAPPPSATTPRR